ncbi:hypothetical protein KAJ89_02725 [Candidatus Parcubacteria bacterium]|nr:hypothetical protein [Candidatus Parcubacteria bacterium]
MEEATSTESCDSTPKYQIFGEEFGYALLTATMACTFALINAVQYVA